MAGPGTAGLAAGVALGRKEEGLREQERGQSVSSGLIQSHPTDALWGFRVPAPAGPKAGSALMGFTQFFCGSVVTFLPGAAADTGKVPIPSQVWKAGSNLPSSAAPPVLGCSELLRAAAAPQGRMAKGQM